jgi:hypothetical protein
MSELNYLQFQEIDSSSDDMSDKHRYQDKIVLDDGIDENSLESYWEKVVQDIHQDPDWFTFSDD